MFSQVKRLNLPEGKYVVHAGSALEGYGIRKSGDIDIAVTKNVYNNLKNKGWLEITKPEGKKALIRDNYEIGIDFGFGKYYATTKHLINTAIIIRGVPFAHIDEVVKLKKASGRKKDRLDLKLIEQQSSFSN